MKIILLCIALIEGAALMSVELLSSRIIAISFGGSIQAWSIILSTTLIGLGLGYYVGGKLSKKQNSQLKYIALILLFSAIFVFFFSEIGSYLTEMFIDFDLVFGTILSSLFLIFPPLFFFGTVSPLIIELISKNNVHISGSSAGLVYSISTFGGIIATFSFGLYFIPYLGVKTSSLIVASTLIFALVLILFSKIFKIN